MRSVCLVTAVYALLVGSLLSLRPLWLDEVNQLAEGARPTVADIVVHVPENPGGVPLGFIEQHYFLRIVGHSTWQARSLAALFGIASVFAVGVLALRLGLERPWGAAALFGVLPLALRYATEARPYSQGIFLSLLATLVFLRLARKPSALSAAAYALTLAAAAYTQPFSALVSGAHVLWALWLRQRKAAVWAAVAAALACASFLPWVLWSRAQWKASIASGLLHFSLTAKTPLMLFRELAGAGYWGSGLLLVLCALALWRGRLDRSSRGFLLLLTAVPIAGGLLGDAVFDYFLAIRQFVWVLPAVVILAASEVERGGRAAVALALALVLLSGYQGWRYFSAREENWEAAARALAAEVDRGACLEVAPPTCRRLYIFFEPRLAHPGRGCNSVVAALSPHAPERDHAALLATLKQQGYSALGSREVGRTTIIRLGR